MTVTVVLTTDLPAGFTFSKKRIRRRRQVGSGEHAWIRTMTVADLNRHGADIGGDQEVSLATVLLDNKPVAYAISGGEEWHTPVGPWWGNGIDFVTKED